MLVGAMLVKKERCDPDRRGAYVAITEMARTGIDRLREAS
jgi:hypothetical protein